MYGLQKSKHSVTLVLLYDNCFYLWLVFLLVNLANLCSPRRRVQSPELMFRAIDYEYVFDCQTVQGKGGNIVHVAINKFCLHVIVLSSLRLIHCYRIWHDVFSELVWVMADISNILNSIRYGSSQCNFSWLKHRHVILDESLSTSKFGPSLLIIFLACFLCFPVFMVTRFVWNKSRENFCRKVAIIPQNGFSYKSTFLEGNGILKFQFKMYLYG